jgi:hypothetical protein
MTKIVESDSTGDTQSFQSLLSQAGKAKTELSVLYELYKAKRDEYDSLRSQVDEKINQMRG